MRVMTKLTSNIFQTISNRGILLETKLFSFCFLAFLSILSSNANLSEAQKCSKKGTEQLKLVGYVDIKSKIQPIPMVFELCAKHYNGIPIRDFEQRHLTKSERIFVRSMNDMEKGNIQSMLNRAIVDDPGWTRQKIRKNLKTYFEIAHNEWKDKLYKDRIISQYHVGEYRFFFHQKEGSDNVLVNEYVKLKSEWMSPYYGKHQSWRTFWADVYRVNQKSNKQITEMKQKSYGHRTNISPDNSAQIYLHYNAIKFDGVYLSQLDVSGDNGNVHPAIRKYLDAKRTIKNGEFSDYPSYFNGLAKKNMKRVSNNQKWQKKIKNEMSQPKKLLFLMKSDPFYVIFFQVDQNNDISIEFNFLLKGQEGYTLLTKNQNPNLASFFESDYFYKSVIKKYTKQPSADDR